MPVTERIQGQGSWSLTLRPDTPKTVRDAITTPWGHIVITPAACDVTGMSDTTVLATSMFTGVCLRPGPQYELGGAGLIWWLGDDKGRDHGFLSSFTSTGRTLGQWRTVLNGTILADGAVAGTGPVGGSIGAQFYNVSRRQAWEALCKYFQVEWRVNPNFTLDFGEPADLYGTTSIATALTKGQGGREFNLTGFRVTDLDFKKDFTDYLSFVRVLGRGGIGQANGSSSGIDFGAGSRSPFGDGMIVAGVFDAPEAALGFETNYAETVVAQYTDVNYVSISTDDRVRPTFGPGYYLNVYDPDRGLLDKDNQTTYQGEIVFPKQVRVIGMQWPIQLGYGVYYRTSATTLFGTPTYVDLSPWVVYERPGTHIEVGSQAFTAIADATSLSTVTPGVKAAPWDTYTPTWSSTGTQPAIGNGTIAGSYRRNGTTLHLRGKMLAGSTTTFGTGEWRISLPTGMTLAGNTNDRQVGRGFLEDTGVASYGFNIVGDIGTSSTVLRCLYEVNAASQQTAVTATAPFTWGNGDQFAWSITLEINP